MRRREWTLTELDARWLEVEDRYNVGIHFLCPFHKLGHRLTLRFEQPYDGEPSVEGPGMLVEVLADGGLNRLTLVPIAGNYYDPIKYEGHGSFRIIEGTLEAERG